MLLAVAVGSPTQAQALPDPGNPICLKPAEETPEIYGPTDVGATLSNQRLSVAVNPQGTLSVLRWPSLSYYEQLKYLTIDRDLNRLGLAPNEGAFSGVVLEHRDGAREIVWLRELRVRQRYRSDDSDTVVTSFRSRRHGFRLELVDIVPERHDVLIRRHRIRITDRSVRRSHLVAFANLNPTASKLPILPAEDWCLEVNGTDRAGYWADADAIVYAIDELDLSTGRPSSAAVAIGSEVRSNGHQVGADRYAFHPLAGAGPQSAYDDARDDARLSSSVVHGPGEVDAAIQVPFRRGLATVYFAPGVNSGDAVRRLQRARRLNARAQSRRKQHAYRHWLRDAPLPRSAPEAVVRLAKRALISLRQAIDERAGEEGDKVAIVASLTTQAPYFLDWIRDGAFFNEALEVIGQHDLVRRHNLFYAETQKKGAEGLLPGSPLLTCVAPTPSGNWFMTNYADGGDAGTFPWEIDETGLGLWALWRHYEWLEKKGRDGGRYLDRIWPAIRRTAEFLVAFRDPVTHLPPGGACEDDNLPTTGQPTMHSAGPVLLAMRSAAKAARTLGRLADARRYQSRAAELGAAIDRTYDVEGGAWTRSYGDGGWAIWPIRVKPYGHPRTEAQAELAWRRVKPSFEAPNGNKVRGQYEAKALHALAKFYRRTDRSKLSRVRKGLRWIAEVQADWQETGILGEAWYVRDGRVISVVAQPHVWEQVLFYLAAIEAYGRDR